MSSSSTSTANDESTFVCDCEKFMRSACNGETFFNEHEGKRYCVLHYPGSEKSSAFIEALNRKLDAKNYNFLGVWFPDELSFVDFLFDEEVHFSYATFNAGANFSRSKFTKKARFSKTTFNAKANFSKAKFSEGSENIFHQGVDFDDAKFKAEVNFYKTTFDGVVNFKSVHCKTKADFSYASFSARVSFNFTIFDGEVDFGAAKFNTEPDSELRYSGPTKFGVPEDVDDPPYLVPIRPIKFRTRASYADADFSHASFRRQASFNSAEFNSKANFRFAKFDGGADFSSVNCGAEAHFNAANFTARANFSDAKFNAEVDFNSARFSGEADFRYAIFGDDVTFSRVTFDDYVRFAGDRGKFLFTNQPSLVFRDVGIENPDRVSFQTVMLRPHWFADLNVRRFNFMSVQWYENITEEIRFLKIVLERIPPYRLLAATYQQLTINAEENRRYEEASSFRYRSMDIRRRERWHGFTFWRLDWWYWAASGYGERIFRAFMMLLGIWLLFAFIYTQVGFARWEPKIMSEADLATAKRDEVGEPQQLPRALIYSLGVMTLQKPEPRPATTWSQCFVLLETIIGPVQAALLALAIRHKFMR